MTVEEMLAEARSRIERVGVGELAASDDAVVVDIRCADERAETGVIPGSIAIARSVLEWRCDPESKWRDPTVARLEARIVLVCAEGYSSSLAADSLRRLGFARPGDLIGGMQAWLDAGMPVDRV